MKTEIFDIKDFTEESYAAALMILPEARRETLKKIHGNAGKLSAAGEMLARRMLSAASGIAPDKITIKREPGGKPYAEGLHLYFNISHSGDIAACTIDLSPIGIDVQKIGPVREGVARRIYTEEERAYVFSGGEGEQERFTKIWCMKEAFAKTLGTSVFTGKSFACRFENGFPAQDYGKLHFSFPEAPEGYVIVLCSKNKG